MVSVGSGERIVAGWILEQRLGSGGYGEVWRARRRHVDLVRALKLIPIVSEGAFESWRHEIGRLEALNHPNVVRFYDADIVADGLYRDYAWIATELCERSLADGLRLRDNHVLPFPEGERLLEAMLAALAAAHAAGMVHRDIKPANILRHRDGTWKLCDFGTARLVPADATHPMTQVIGTSPYMSPAAHRGQQNRAADLYALGVTVHEALQGERLHPRPEGMTDGEYIKSVLDNPPTVSPHLPKRWRTIVTTLIGEHGPLTAAQLVAWFAATRGEQPPTAVNVPGATVGTSAAAVTGVTVAAGTAAAAAAAGAAAAGGAGAASGNGGANGTAGTVAAAEGGRTAATALAAAPPASSSPVRRVHVPAPDPKPPPPPPPPPPPAAKAPSDGSGSAAAAAAPAPARSPTPVQAPHQAPPRQQAASRPPAPVAPAVPPPPPIWVSAAVDPTAPMGRRVFAWLVDWLAILIMAGGLFVAGVVTNYEKLPPPQGSESVEASCDLVQSESCFRFGDTVYYTTSRTLSFTPFAMLAGLAYLILLQGLTGATVGKFLTGLRVVDRDGRPPGFLRAFVRTVFLVVDAFPWAVPIFGWAVALGNARHRRVGDFAAGTMVVRRRALAYGRR